MQCANGRIKHSVEKAANTSCCSLSERSLEAKDHQLTPMIRRNSEHRSVLLTFVTLELDARFLPLVYLPLQGSENTCSEGCGKVDGVDAVSPPPPFILFHVALPQEQRILSPERRFENLLMSGSSTGSNLLRKSRYRGLSNRRKKSVKISATTSPQNCLVTNNSSDSVYDSSKYDNIDDLIKEILKEDKPAKKSSRKKAKKKGKQYKKSTCKMDSSGNGEAVQETVGGISLSKTHVLSSPFHRDITVSSPSVPINDDIENHGNDMSDDSVVTVTCMSHGDITHGSEPAIFLTEDCTGKCSSSGLKTSMIQKSGMISSTCNGNAANTRRMRSSNRRKVSSFALNKYNALAVDSFSDDWSSDNSANGNDDIGAISSINGDGGIRSSNRGLVSDLINHGISLDCLASRNEDVPKNDHLSKNPVDADMISEGTCSTHQPCSSNGVYPATLNKRGRHGRKSTGSSNGTQKFGNANVHGRSGNDVNHSVWQKVQKNRSRGDIGELKNANPVRCNPEANSVSSDLSFPCDISAIKHEKCYKSSCFDEMDVLKSDAVKSDNDYTCKKNSEKFKRKPSSRHKQEHNHYSRKGTDTSNTNGTSSTKIHIQQKIVSEVSSRIHDGDISASVLKSSCYSDFGTEDILNDEIDHSPSKSSQDAPIHLDEEILGSNIIAFQDAETQSSQYQSSPSSEISDPSYLTYVNEAHVDSCAKMPKNISIGNESEGCLKSETDNSHAEQTQPDDSSGPEKDWIPIDSGDVVVCRSDKFITTTTDELDSDGWSSNKVEEEQLVPNLCHSLPLSDMGLACPVPRLHPDMETGKVTSSEFCISEGKSKTQAAFNSWMTHEENVHSLATMETDVAKIVHVVNDAYKLRTASEGVHLATGSPLAEFERLLLSASPVLCQTFDFHCCKMCSRNQLTSDSLCQHQVPNIPLGNLWQWYEKPGSYGLEVKVEDYRSSKRLGRHRSNFCAYFVPYLSAVQLFGRSRSSVCKNMGCSKMETIAGDGKTASNNSTYLSRLPILSILVPQPLRTHENLHSPESCSSNQDVFCAQSDCSMCSVDAELIFEYFESDRPQYRQPLHEKIKQLVSGYTSPDCQIYGDPSRLDCLDMHDLHPASWYSVAWYPIYRIPDGNFRAAFLTYHSLGHFIRRSASSVSLSGSASIVSPVVGLQSYNAQGECWFQPNKYAGDLLEDSFSSPSEILKERLRTLEQTAGVMARATVCKNGVKSVNKQPDYEFFLSRRW
ncbi:hypothetical protein QJS10_CPA03g02584 [Acorus calamus]|uniref:Uncharacterized protein n=1 Tax=Acorus calamus TaxID=4465 RepID=A0AAV9F6X6_ACOCL|nr:hypothetical protein QJS10_CPA03g02584 [Acorus calamus]